MLDAMCDVIAEHLFLDTPQRCSNGRDLRHDIDAVPTLLDHPGQSAHLSLDTVQAFQARSFGLFLHALTHTLWGYICQGKYPAWVWARSGNMVAHEGSSDHGHRLEHKGEGCCACSHGESSSAPQIAKDPVCGMSVDPNTAKHQASYLGTTYYFCREGCREKFLAEPEKYIKPAAKPSAPAASIPAGTIYTCPMHPQIRQVGPGHARSAAWHLNPSS